MNLDEIGHLNQTIYRLEIENRAAQREIEEERRINSRLRSNLVVAQNRLEMCLSGRG